MATTKTYRARLKKDEDEEKKKAKKSPTLNSFLSAVFSEPEVFESRSSIPEDYGEGILPWIGENIVNPIARPIEQFGRLIPGVGFEAMRAADMRGWLPGSYNTTDVANWDDPGKRAYMESIMNEENPFVPGLNKATPLESTQMIAQRAGKAALDAVLLKGLGGFGKAGLKGMAARGAAEGAAFPLTQEEAPTTQDILATGAGGAVAGPIFGTAMKVGLPQAVKLAQRLLGKGGKEVLDDVTAQAIANTALVKTPTPVELAQMRLKQKQFQTRMSETQFPAGTGMTPEGAVQVPPGGFQAFQPEGFQTQREPMEGVVMDSGNMATDLLESILGKRKTLALQRQVIEGKVGEPFPTPERILVKPIGQRPNPVLGQYKIERPFFNDMPPEVQEISAAIAPDVPNVVPEHVPTSISNIPIEKRTTSNLDVLARTVWRPMQDAIEKTGKVGEALSKKITNFRANEYNMRGKMQVKVDEAFGKLKLTPDEELNAWEAAQDLAAPMNEKVAAAAQRSKNFAKEFLSEAVDSRGMRKNFVDDTGSPFIDPDKYVPHKLNDAGWRAYEFDENKFFDRWAEHNMQAGKDFAQTRAEIVSDWKFLQRSMTPKAPFERQRTWSIPPEYMERNLHKLWTRQNASAAKRFALLDEFGAPLDEVDAEGNRVLTYTQIKDALNSIQEESGLNDMRYVQNAMDIIVGRSPSDFQLKKIISDVTEFQLISKLTPLTMLSNISQGFSSSVYRHGFKYALQGLKDTFSEAGKEFTTKTGLVGQGYYSGNRHTKAIKAWEHISKFPWSEDFNFRVNTNSAKHFIEDMFIRLTKNPKDTYAAKQLEVHGLNPKQLLSAGKLTEDDLLKGSFISGRDSIFPRMAEQVPQWVNNPMGKLIYQFSHYALKQPKMLQSQFKVSKGRGLSALAKWAVTQAALGEPVADFWAALKGEDRPETIAGRGLENILAAQALGVPYEIYKKMSGEYTGPAGMFAGPTISGLVNSGGRIVKDLQAGEPGKAVEDLFRSRVKGDIPFVGPPVPAGSFLERLVPREDLERGKKEEETKYKVRLAQ